MYKAKITGLLIGLALVSTPLVGCGSSQDSFVVGDSSVQGQSQAFVGRLDLGFGGAASTRAVIEVQDLNGQVLGQAALEPGGYFRLPDSNLPSDFRLVARLAPGLEFATDVRDYQNQPISTNINVATSLASAYLAANPGASLESAEDLVRRYLHFPAERRLGQDTDESPRSIFSQYAFFVEAARNGGWPAYRDQIVARLSENRDTSPVYRLDRTTLQADLGALHPDLVSSLQTLRNSRKFQLATTSLSAHPVPDVGSKILGEPSKFSAQPTANRSEVRAKILESITDKAVEVVTDGAINQGIDVGWTHVAEGLGLNYGTTAQLDAIQQSLAAMQDYLNELGDTIDQDAIEEEADQIADDISTITDLNQDLIDNDVNSNIDDEEQPFTPSQSVNSLLSSLLGFQAQTALTTIQNSMLGAGQQGSLLKNFRDKLLGDDLGVNSTADNGFFAIRNNAIIDESLQAFSYYSGYQALGANILGEISHLGTEATPPQNPVSSMQISDDIATDAIISLKKQRALSPFYQASDNIFVDLQAGLMWYTVMVGDHSMSDALTHADNFSTTVTYQTSVLTSESDQPQGLPTNVVSVTYSDWHLPTENEYRTLQNRARLVSIDRRDTSVAHSGDDDYGDYDSASQGLTALGFTGLEKLNSNGSMLCSDWSFDTKGNWFPEWTGKFDPNNEFIFNNGGITDIGQTTKQRPFLMVRPIGEPVIPVGEDNLVGSPNTPYPYPWSQIQAAEFPFLGHVTNLDGGGGISLEQLGADVEWTVIVGGSYSMGVNNDASESFVSRTYRASLATYTGQPGSSNVALNDLSDLVWFTSSNESLVSVSPNGRMYWHVDSPGNQSVQFTAHVSDGDGNEKTFDFTVTENPPLRQLQAVQIYPRNRIYTVPNGNPSAQEKYYCIAYYSDNTVEDVSDQVTWNLVVDSTGAPADPNVASIAPKNDADHGNFIGTTPPSDTIYRIEASLGSASTQNDEVLLELTDGV